MRKVILTLALTLLLFSPVFGQENSMEYVGPERTHEMYAGAVRCGSVRVVAVTPNGYVRLDFSHGSSLKFTGDSGWRALGAAVGSASRAANIGMTINFIDGNLHGFRLE